jgi:hypothetical protein
MKLNWIVLISISITYSRTAYKRQTQMESYHDIWRSTWWKHFIVESGSNDRHLQNHGSIYMAHVGRVGTSWKPFFIVLSFALKTVRVVIISRW